MIMLAVALLMSMVLCLLFGVPYIDFLRKKTIGQYILDVAPEAHAKKAGTPTTGGVFIILAIIIASIITLLMAQQMDNSAWIIIITLLFMALAGFQDDYLKIKGHENKGLSPRGKLVTWIITERVSITKIPPNKASKISHLPITARVPNKPPNAKEPVSPMNTCAFGLLYLKKPISAPITVAATIAEAVCPPKYAIIPQAKNAGIPVEAASPSSPSVKLYALDAPVTTNTVKIGYKKPKSKSMEPRVITVP